MHFTLKNNPLRYEDLEDFIKCYNPANRNERFETDRFRVFTYNELVHREKTDLDISWLKDDSIEDFDNLLEPDILAQEIIENLQIVLQQFNSIYNELGKE